MGRRNPGCGERGALAHLPRGYWRRATLQEPFPGPAPLLEDRTGRGGKTWPTPAKQANGRMSGHGPWATAMSLMIRVSHRHHSVWLLPKFESACI